MVCKNQFWLWDYSSTVAIQESHNFICITFLVNSVTGFSVTIKITVITNFKVTVTVTTNWLHTSSIRMSFTFIIKLFSRITTFYYICWSLPARLSTLQHEPRRRSRVFYPRSFCVEQSVSQLALTRHLRGLFQKEAKDFHTAYWLRICCLWEFSAYL